jgi:hypothetical protein
MLSHLLFLSTVECGDFPQWRLYVCARRNLCRNLPTCSDKSGPEGSTVTVCAPAPTRFAYFSHAPFIFLSRMTRVIHPSHPSHPSHPVGHCDGSGCRTRRDSEGTRTMPFHALVYIILSLFHGLYFISHCMIFHVLYRILIMNGRLTAVSRPWRRWCTRTGL